MKLKYFLRGLGIGIIFGAIIMLAAYMTSGGYKISDDEVIKRAEKLGMVMDNSYLTATGSDANNNKDKVNDINDTDDKQNTESNKPSGTSTDASTTESKSDLNDNKTTETMDDDSYITAKIEVTSGMSSIQVAELLQNADIIEDYQKFDAYLTEKGYSTKIRVKTCEVNNRMTFEELAQELISGTDN